MPQREAHGGCRSVLGIVPTHVGWLFASVTPPVLSLGVVLTSDTTWIEAARLSPADRTRIVGHMLLMEAALLVIFAPLWGVFSALRRAPLRRVRSAAVERFGGTVRLAWPLIGRITVMTGASALIAFAMRPGIEAMALAQCHAIIWAAALALGTLGTTSACLLSDPLDAAACAVVIAGGAAFSVLVAGPALDPLPPALLDAVLTVNPIVGVAAAAGIDLFRMEPLYRMSSLAHVEYPAAASTFGVHVLISVALLLLTARDGHRRRTITSIERMPV